MSPITARCCLLLSLLLAACSKGIDYRTHGGDSGRFAEHRGQWLVINYWATWCKPCIEEIPELNAFARARDDVVVFGVDFDQNQGDALQAGIDKLGIRFPVLTQDPSATLGAERPSMLPTTLVFNPRGELHRTLRGPQTHDSLAAAVGGKNSPEQGNDSLERRNDSPKPGKTEPE